MYDYGSDAAKAREDAQYQRDLDEHKRKDQEAVAMEERFLSKFDGVSEAALAYACREVVQLRHRMARARVELGGM